MFLALALVAKKELPWSYQNHVRFSKSISVLFVLFYHIFKCEPCTCLLQYNVMSAHLFMNRVMFNLSIGTVGAIVKFQGVQNFNT